MPPKENPARRNARVGPVVLPAEGRKGNPPVWPIPGIQSLDEQLLWEQLWSSPQAVAWERMGIATCREVARYCRLLIVAEGYEAKAADQAQATALADRLGLTPKAMRLLLWTIAADEVAEKRQETSAGARGRIKAVG
jgi:hypothetical protein